MTSPFPKNESGIGPEYEHIVLLDRSFTHKHNYADKKTLYLGRAGAWRTYAETMMWSRSVFYYQRLFTNPLSEKGFWVKEANIGNHEYIYDFRVYDRIYEFCATFENANDALLFKMRWL